jgi:hypothetical protein
MCHTNKFTIVDEVISSGKDSGVSRGYFSNLLGESAIFKVK